MTVKAATPIIKRWTTLGNILSLKRLHPFLRCFKRAILFIAFSKIRCSQHGEVLPIFSNKDVLILGHLNIFIQMSR